MPLKTTHRPDEILGYELKDRLGAGGYGEVWRAEAPGGIAKAIKLIYGYHDENRATRELRALNRVKELRHPFLLSLDRIDVVNGQLVIVTEMADCCLKDRFDTCRDEGLPGIPREELLRYLRDAADALDFIGVQHSLQHLDIKPENLLLVSGHVKVADFGLVKEITDASQSLMGGLTPAYSPPELFDGRPCHASDQYSLAIVYQEMLTGERPFPGTTAAQLASQHMNMRPQLGALPRGDQKVVAKALSKDPGRRYASCVDLVDELTDRQIVRATPAASPGTGRHGKNEVRRRSPPAGNSTHCVTKELPSSFLPTERSEVAINKLPPITTDAGQALQRPTLLIGIGHTGVSVMRDLRQQIRKRWGGDQFLPAVRVLCLDTDERDLINMTLGKVNESLRPEETLAIPLRRSEEYRKDGADFGWISRRWLYNIPRSLQTEGVRPLGRLAFADHHSSILDKLHEAVEDITGEGKLDETAKTTGLKLQDESPRVFIVASIAGGVGSGCVLDVAYTARAVLLEHGLDASQICGVLVHASGASSTDRDLTSANTYACLSELHHFTSVDGYPGDVSCGIPAFGQDQPPFSSTYFVDLGHNLIQDEYENATQTIAHYLLLNSLTPASVFFDECRRIDSSQVEEMTVRAFGTSSGLPPGFRQLHGELPHDVLTLRLCDQLLQVWGGDCDERLSDVVPSEFTQTQFAKFGISLEEVVRRGNQLLLDTLGHDLPSCLDTSVEKVLSERKKISSHHDREAFAVAIESAIDQVLGELKAAEERSPVPLAAVRSLAVDWFNPLQSAIRGLVDQPAARNDAALRVAENCRRRLHGLVDQLAASSEQADQDLETARAKISGNMAESGKRKVAVICHEAGQASAQLRLQQLSLAVAKILIQEMEMLCQDFMQQQSEFAERVKQFATSCRALYRTELATEEDPREARKVADGQEAAQPLTNMVQQLDHLVQQSLEQRCGGIANLVEDEDALESFARSLLILARRLVTQTVRQVDRDPNLDGLSAQSPVTIQWLRNHLELAKPTGTRFGGGLRLLLTAPEPCPVDEYVQVLKSEFDEQPSTMPSTSGELTVCYEMEDIRLTDVALSLLENRPDCAEFVRRLQSRNDVEWAPLTGVL